MRQFSGKIVTTALCNLQLVIYQYNVYEYLLTSQCLAEKRIVCGYTLIRLKLWGKQDVGLRPIKKKSI